MQVQVLNGGGAAWRARYLIVNGRQVAHIGVDPREGVTPALFGAVGNVSFRLPLPTVRWRMNRGRLYLFAYRLSSAFWHGMDGRYGWGTKRD
jgi:hypothetical protein